jgi:type IV pilus assembly protein PilX
MSPFPLAASRAGGVPRQRGIVLFIALVAMVVLSLAGVALVRSIDTGTSAAGNIGMRHASIVAINWAVEKAVDDIYKSRNIADLTLDDPGHNYYAKLQLLEKKDATPNVLSGVWPVATYPFAVHTDVTTNAEIRYVIERVCSDTGPPTVAICDLLPPKLSPAGTDNEIKRIPIPPIPHFRVTVRVDLPNTNTASYAQTFLR